MREREREFSDVRANGGRTSCNEIQPHWIHGAVSDVELPSLLKFLSTIREREAEKEWGHETFVSFRHLRPVTRPWRIDNRRPNYSACASRKVNTFLSHVELCFMNFPSVARSSAKSL